MVPAYVNLGLPFFGILTCFLPNPVDLFGWGDQDEDFLCVQATSRTLRKPAQEATLEEVGNGKLSRVPGYSKTSNCADVKIGKSVLFYRAPNRKSLPK